jgi:hypothetical protein
MAKNKVADAMREEVDLVIRVYPQLQDHKDELVEFSFVCAARALSISIEQFNSLNESLFKEKYGPN